MVYNYNFFLEQFKNIPFIDAHNHVMHQRIGCWAEGNIPCRASSKLAGILTGFSSLLCFISSGMSFEQANKIRSGEFDRETCKGTVLRYLPLCIHMIPVASAVRGIGLILNTNLDDINEQNWDELDAALSLKYSNDLAYYCSALDQNNINKAVLNMWAGWGLSYYGSYQESLTEEEKEMDRRCFIRSATLDSYSMDPFSPVTEKYAAMVSANISNFEGYCDFICSLANFFVKERSVKAFKISECYYRTLDYEKIEKSRAKACFKEKRTPGESKALSDYVTWLVFEQADRLEVPVQIHTGELWGEVKAEAVNPIYLVNAIKAFPNVKFDLLHCGYPFMGETGIMATNLRNVYINMAYCPFHSLRHFEHWMGVYLNSASADRILMGTDVFDIEPMIGCIEYIRESLARQAAYMIDSQIASCKNTSSIFERMLNKNAVNLYKIE